MARVAPVESGDGSIVVATVDSIYRIDAGDGGVSHRIASPGTIVSPWISYRGGLVAGTTDSQVVALGPRRSRAAMERPGRRPGARLARGHRRHALCGQPAGHAVPYPARRSTGPPERVVELEWPVTAPVTVVDDRSCWAAPTARCARSGPTAPKSGGSSSGGPSSWGRCALDRRPARHRRQRRPPPVPAMTRIVSALLALTVALDDVPAGAQDSGPLIRYGKWVLAAGAVGMNLLAAKAHNRAEDAFDAIEDACFVERTRCIRRPRAEPTPIPRSRGSTSLRCTTTAAPAAGSSPVRPPCSAPPRCSCWR